MHAATVTDCACKREAMPTDENNGGGVLPGDAEEVANSSGSHALKHLHKLRAVGRKEGNIGGSCHGFGQVRLPCAWGTLQQNPLHAKDTFHTLYLYGHRNISASLRKRTKPLRDSYTAIQGSSAQQPATMRLLVAFQILLYVEHSPVG